MREPLALPPLPVLRGDRVVLREPRDSDIDDRIAFPIDPEEEDAYGSAWRRGWDGRRFHTREYLVANRKPPPPGAYEWVVEHGDHNIGGTGLQVDPGQHTAEFSIGIFVPSLRGQGLGKEITRLVRDWGFGTLGLHRIELQVLASNNRAIRCYLACGFRQEGLRREAELYPDGWKDFIIMGVLSREIA
jgi:ribosomal-protein-alanine N-acetyltransferase